MTPDTDSEIPSQSNSNIASMNSSKKAEGAVKEKKKNSKLSPLKENAIRQIWQYYGAAGIILLSVGVMTYAYSSFLLSKRTSISARKSKHPSNHNVNSHFYDDESQQWEKDIEFYNLSLNTMSSLCDFPIVTEEQLRQNPSEYMQLPFVLRGLTTDWTANEYWKRPNLISRYGKRSVSTGSESSIVYGGGAAGVIMSLETILNRIRNTTLQKSSNLFTFDVSILKAIPELKRDFTVPKPFRPWDTPEAESQGYSWHMLSLGPSKAGLPFHIHSLTWIAVIHGAKRWFVYPPGGSPSLEAERKLSSLMTVWDWFTRIYPLLSVLEKVPFVPYIDQPGNHPGYRPLECLQQSGDIVYLPKAWSHMTLNVGETIGIGGQAAFPATERYEHALQVLEGSPLNFQALKAASLALSHFAVDENDRIRNELLKTSSGVIQLRSDNFHDLVILSNDTWVVIYASLEENSRESHYMMSMINQVAKSLNDSGMAVNVGMFDVKGQSQVLVHHKLQQYCFIREGAPNDPTSILPCIRLYPGSPWSTSCNSKMNDIKNTYHPQSANSHTIDRWESVSRDVFLYDSGLTYGGPVQAIPVTDYAIQLMTVCDLDQGSILSVSVKGRNWLKQATKYVRQSIEVEPYNSEVNAFHGEILGYANDRDAMIQAIQEAEQRFDELIKIEYKNRSKDDILPTQTIASIYQKLGHTYLTKEMAVNAIPLLEKALQYEQFYSPALVSLIIAHNMNGDIHKAEDYLRILEIHEPRNPAVRDLKYLMNKVKSTSNRKKHGTQQIDQDSVRPPMKKRPNRQQLNSRPVSDNEF